MLSGMVFPDALAAIDEEISQLKKARALLSGGEVATDGRISKKMAVRKAPAAAATPGKRTMSAEGRASIAAAQKKRWAVLKKAGK
jgi:hypothetical protein